MSEEIFVNTETTITNSVGYDTDTAYTVVKKINLTLSVLTFAIIVFFMYRYLKSVFQRKRG